MELLTSKEISDHVTSIIHTGTQLHEYCIDLTVNALENPVQPGSLDFGGSEFAPAKTERIQPQKRTAEDDYGWWSLESGSCKIIFNEQLSLDERTLAFITPHNHAQEAGISGNTQIIRTSGEINMTINVPNTGVNIKENARLATAYLFRI